VTMDFSLPDSFCVDVEAVPTVDCVPNAFDVFLLRLALRNSPCLAYSWIVLGVVVGLVEPSEPSEWDLGATHTVEVAHGGERRLEAAKNSGPRAAMPSRV
jgi:hypothetical protein